MNKFIRYAVFFSLIASFALFTGAQAQTTGSWVCPAPAGTLLPNQCFVNHNDCLATCGTACYPAPNSICTPPTAPVVTTTTSSTSSAQTIANLQAEIQSLLAQLKVLQQELAVAEGTAPWCHTFLTNLRIGNTGSEVAALQTALQKSGMQISMNSNFDDQTASAVTGFQEKYASDILTPNGLQYGTGYVGAATRAKLNSLYGCSKGY